MSEFDIFFDEYESKHNFSPEKRECFEAGQQSKKAEVDELQLKLSEDSRVLHNVIDIERKKCEELQKRIDRAVERIEDYYGVVELSMIVDILNGEQS